MNLVNEPSGEIPLDVLKYFYWESYKLVQAKVPHWITIFHDSFRLTPENWIDFMPGCPNYAFDSHIYQAWADDAPISWFHTHSCYDGYQLKKMESLGIPIIVGEWSLAVDNCAMWLNGLNDNVYGYPKTTCEMVDCPFPYFGAGKIPNAPVDPTKGIQDPFGTGIYLI
jgi:glucan 1,3-beta-glucosidase